MSLFISDTFHLFMRHVRTTLRLPIWIAVMLVQPVIWLTLFGQLFRRVVELPGFESTSYIQYLTPGVIVMTSLFSALWSGMGMIQDHEEGVLDRLLATPGHRGAVIAARVLHSSATVAVQSLLVLILGLVLGARIPGGAAGLLVVILAAVLLAAGMASLSNGLALIARREETLIAIVNFFGMPLSFLSTAFMAAAAMPGWIRAIARFNPVNWATVAARSAMQGDAWLTSAAYCGLLLAFTIVTGFVATQAFRAYLRTT